jgi:hypothetical protein
MISNCDEDIYDDCEGYKTDDIDYHVGSDYSVGQLALRMWLVVALFCFVLWYFWNWLLCC